MGKPAARLGDLAGHAGIIMYGTPSVLIGGMPAARIGDPLICPGFDGPKPHVMGNITKGSSSVKIGNSYAARLGDSTGCGTAGVIGFNMPPIIGPPIPVTPNVPDEPSPDNTYTFVSTGYIGDKKGNMLGVSSKEVPKNSAGLLWIQGKEYHNLLGVRGEMGASLIHIEGEKSNEYGKIGGSIDEGNIESEAHIGLLSAGMNIKASAIKASANIVSDDKAPVYIGVGGEVKALTAEIKADLLMGTDGRRSGFFLGFKAQASSAEAEGSVQSGINIPIPFTEKKISLGAKAKGDVKVGSVGGGLAGGIYHDKDDDKLHLSIESELSAFLIGAEVDLDVMIGLTDNKPPTLPNISPNTLAQSKSGGVVGSGIPLTPGSIAKGCSSVLIG